MTARKIFLFIAIILAFAWHAEAQPMVLSSNRWLIVVNTSASMDSRQQATMDSVGAMLLSGMNGQLRPGDTIGIWTFNETLTKGKFPLQLWHSEVNQQIASSAVQFLKSLKYQKSTRFDCVMPDINRLVTNSDILTVVLFTDGEATLKGTPFDDSINATFKKDFKTQKKAKAPFIIAFRSEVGRMTAFTLTPAPWLATFPPLPPAPVYIATAPMPPPPIPAIAPAPEPPPAPVVPSIILSGKKADSTNAAGETTSSVEGQAPITLRSDTMATLVPDPSAINTQNATVVDTQVVETASVDTNMPPPETVVPQPAPQIPETPTAPTVQTPPPLPASVDAATAEIRHIEGTQPTNVQVITAPETSTVANKNSTSASQQAVAPAATATSTPAPAAIPAVAMTPTTGSGSPTKLFLGIGLLIIAVGIGVLWTRKSRPPAGGSLITRSLDKDKRDS